MLDSTFQSHPSEFNSMGVVIFALVVELVLSVALAVEFAVEFPIVVPADAVEFIELFVPF